MTHLRWSFPYSWIPYPQSIFLAVCWFFLISSFTFLSVLSIKLQNLILFIFLFYFFLITKILFLLPRQWLPCFLKHSFQLKSSVQQCLSPDNWLYIICHTICYKTHMCNHFHYYFLFSINLPVSFTWSSNLLVPLHYFSW